MPSQTVFSWPADAPTANHKVATAAPKIIQVPDLREITAFDALALLDLLIGSPSARKNDPSQHHTPPRASRFCTPGWIKTRRKQAGCSLVEGPPPVASLLDRAKAGGKPQEFLE